MIEVITILTAKNLADFNKILAHVADYTIEVDAAKFQVKIITNIDL